MEGTGSSHPNPRRKDVPMPRFRPGIRPIASLALVILVLVGADQPPAAVKQAPVKPDLETTLRQMEKDVAAVRGLAFKTPVKGKIIPRPKDGERGIQGYYSTKDKALFVYDDIAGNYERGVLIHELVHALQDQHFGLSRRDDAPPGSDAEMAMSALIEGDATFTMIEVLKKDQPRVAAMLDQPLEKARNLRNAFLYAQGARYVKALKEKGGWEAVNRAYRFLAPHTSAAILHPEGVATFELGSGKIVGEYGLIAKLKEQPATAADAVAVAAGWRADRLVESKDGSTWEIAFATADQARRGRESLARLSAPAGRSRTVVARGERVFVIDAANEAAGKALLDHATGPQEFTVYDAKEKRVITFGELIDRLLPADIVCIGESHDSEPNHRVQLRIIQALYACDDRLGVGMEMFQRPFQKEIDRYFQGSIGEDDFLKASEYKQRWGYAWPLYRPIVEFCRRNSIPLAALNAPKELTQRISKVGHAALTDDEKKQLGPVDFQVKVHRDYWLDKLSAMHGKSAASADQKERSYQVMTVWDEYMGASAAAFQQERNLRRMVVLAGSGHIERGFGIAARAAKRTGGKAITVRVATSGTVEKIQSDPAADYVVIIK
jgi:uncharacterized iron-regulated protein